MNNDTAHIVDVADYAQKRRPTIGKQIRKARRKHGWTQASTADYLGCSRRRVNRAERGITDLSVFELELLAQVFQVPFTFFLETV